MDQLGINAAGGMRSLTESLDLLANNLANVGTAGYKADREFYNLFVSAEAEGDPAARLPVIDRAWTDFSQGVLKTTSQPLDFALHGPGFFVADSPAGPLLTRNGAFHLSPRGVIETQEGHPVRIVDAQGRRQPVTLDAQAQVEVRPDGALFVDGQARGRIAVLEPEDSRTLAKHGANYYRLSPGALLANAPAEVLQGRLEASNVGPAETTVRLISILRQFEMLQKALTLGSEMNRRAVDEVARVTG